MQRWIFRSSLSSSIMIIIYLVVGDGDLVLLASALVASRHVQDAVGVDVEGDLDLRNTTEGVGGAQVDTNCLLLGHLGLVLT